MNRDRLQLDNSDNINSFIGRGQRLPKPPKKGEMMYCQVCGGPMPPSCFSKNETERKREFKWHIHHDCFLYLDRLADQSVPGLLTERKQMAQRQQQG